MNNDTSHRRQIVVIHGGDPARPYKEYLAELNAEHPDKDDFKSSTGWKDSLREKLGDKFEVFDPRMPLEENARYSEWKIWFDKLVPFLDDGSVLIGHSLGGIFLAKYLSEVRFPKKIRAVMLVAAPYRRSKARSDSFGGFSFKKSLELLSTQSETVFLYHSKDDPVVEFSDREKFSSELPGAILRTFTDRKHIWQKDFPEIIADIKGL